MKRVLWWRSRFCEEVVGSLVFGWHLYDLSRNGNTQRSPCKKILKPQSFRRHFPHWYPIEGCRLFIDMKSHSQTNLNTISNANPSQINTPPRVSRLNLAQLRGPQLIARSAMLDVSRIDPIHDQTHGVTRIRKLIGKTVAGIEMTFLVQRISKHH